MQLHTANRLFKIGSITLPDPDPNLPPHDAVQMYASSYPQVIDATLSDPQVNSNGDLEFTVERPAVKTKG